MPYSQMQPWNSGQSWENNLINRGVGNTFDFLKMDPSSLYGEETGYLTDQLKGTIGGKLDPALAKILSSGRRGISESADVARRKVGQSLASSGFRGSGANIFSEISKGSASALGDLEANVGEMGFQGRQNAIAQLLGLNQMQTGVNVDITGRQVGAGQDLFSTMYGARQAEAAQPDFWGSLVGGLVGPAATVIAASDKKLKKNIKGTGIKTSEGIPIKTFKYKNDRTGKTFMGMLAQDVEKKHPEAVVKAIDYSKVPEGIFREIN